jgi:hypothetical protein
MPQLPCVRCVDSQRSREKKGQCVRELPLAALADAFAVGATGWKKMGHFFWRCRRRRAHPHADEKNTPRPTLVPHACARPLVRPTIFF